MAYIVEEPLLRRRGLRQLFVISVVTAVIVASRASPTALGAEAECDRICRFVEETFDVEVVLASTSFDVNGDGWRLDGASVSRDEANQFLPLFARELFLYPVSAVGSSGLKRTVVCTRLALRGQEVGGVANCGDGTLYLNASSGCSPFASAAIHHEFFHFIDFSDDGVVGADERWSALNPRGFTYGSDLNGRRDPWALTFTELFPGFLTRYCLAALEEDKAELFSHLIVNRAYVLHRAEHDPLLKAKLDVLKSSAFAFCPEMDESFWESAARLHRPPPPSVSSSFEEHRLFLDALRQRELFDVALDYLALLRVSPGAAKVNLNDLLFDEGRFLTYAAHADTQEVAGTELLRLACTRFSEAAKGGPLAASAEIELGNVLVERATELEREADSPEGLSSTEISRQSTRELLNDAKQAFDRAALMQSSRLKKLNLEFETTKNAHARALRDIARGDVLTARLHAAEVLWRMAGTYERGSQEERNLLSRAAEAYRNIYARHSRRLAGLTALLGEAQCRHALAEMAEAAADLETVLSYPDEPALGPLKTSALHLRLRWLSTEGTNDYSLVASRGEAWLNAASPRDIGTIDGIGVAYYTALAKMNLATHPDCGEERRKGLLTYAVKWARFVVEAPIAVNPYRTAGRQLYHQLIAKQAGLGGRQKGQRRQKGRDRKRDVGR